MNIKEKMRIDFENVISNWWEYPTMIDFYKETETDFKFKKDKNGNYILLQTHILWSVWQAAFLAERDAEQQPEAEAGKNVSLDDFIESLYAAEITALHAKLLTHPSQVITRERLVEYFKWSENGLNPPEYLADKLLAEINPAQETKL